MKSRIIRIVAASILGLVVFIVAFAAYHYFTDTEPRYTLREALWVSDRDMKHFYPPYSPQAQSIVGIIKKESVIDPDKKAYNDYVLYRMGLSTKDKPAESLLILGFRPPKE